MVVSQWLSVALIANSALCFTITNVDPLLPTQELLDDNSFIRHYPHNISRIIMCPIGTFMDKDTLTCEFVRTVTETNDEEYEDEDESICIPRRTMKTVVPVKEDCRYFMLCGPSGSYLESCPGTLLFNKFISTCDYWQCADCCEYKENNSSRLLPNS